MRSRNPLGTQAILEACIKWPDLPSRTLARMLVKEHPKLWSSGVEGCRSGILFRRGKSVKKDRGQIRRCKTIVASTCPAVPHRPDAYLPKSFEKDWVPFELKVDRDTRIAVMGDLHFPYQNNPSIHLALTRAKKNNCKVIYINGDLIDFHKISRWNHDPDSRSTVEEIEAANQFLDAVDDRFPKARKIFKFGNHDERFDHYIAANAAELFGLIKEKASLPHLLELENRGWEWIDDKRPAHLGGLTLIHGHEYPTPVIGPVNAARGLFLRTKASAMVSHHHASSEHSETNIRGKLITTWSLGCLCDLHPMYARFNKWNHGAAEVELSASGEFQVENYRILNGREL